MVIPPDIINHYLIMAAQETPSTAQMAESRLWEFQLRKEHAGLLRKIEQIGEERNEELRSLRTMMNAGEDLVERDRVKIADLQRRFDELVRVVTEQRARIREFEDGVRNFLKGRVSHGGYLLCLSRPRLMRYRATRRDHGGGGVY